MNNNRIRADITIEHGYQFYSRILTNLGAMPSEDSAKRIFLKDRKPGLYNGLKAGLDPYQFTYW